MRKNIFPPQFSSNHDCHHGCRKPVPLSSLARSESHPGLLFVSKRRHTCRISSVEFYRPESSRADHSLKEFDCVSRPAIFAATAGHNLDVSLVNRQRVGLDSDVQASDVASLSRARTNHHCSAGQSIVEGSGQNFRVCSDIGLLHRGAMIVRS